MHTSLSKIKSLEANIHTRKIKSTGFPPHSFSPKSLMRWAVEDFLKSWKSSTNQNRDGGSTNSALNNSSEIQPPIEGLKITKACQQTMKIYQVCLIWQRKKATLAKLNGFQKLLPITTIHHADKPTIFWHVRFFKRVIFSCRKTEKVYILEKTSGSYLRSLRCQNISEEEWSLHFCECKCRQKFIEGTDALSRNSMKSGLFRIAIFLQQCTKLPSWVGIFHNKSWKTIKRIQEMGEFKRGNIQVRKRSKIYSSDLN